MAINLVLDDKLILEAQKISGHRTKKVVVAEALQECVQRRKQLKVLNLFNKIEYNDDHDYKKQRQIP